MIARNGCSASRGTGAQLPWNAQPELSAIEREWRDRGEPEPKATPDEEPKARAEAISRARPRDAARLILSRFMVDGVSRLRCQGGEFWLWEGGTYERQSDAAITKLVSDFLDGARTSDGAAFNPKRRDTEEVLAALWIEAHLDDRFVAPCWLPSGEPATDWIVCRNGIVNVRNGERRPHSHKLWAHGTLAWDWQPDAVCPVFDRFLQSVFPDDGEAHACLEEFLGLSMTLDVKAQKGVLLLARLRGLGYFAPESDCKSIAGGERSSLQGVGLGDWV